MVAVATVIIAVVVSIIISRVATVALTVTGLSRESARFQARSALTGTGFTTSEAERVVEHPVRRRIVMILMLVGNAGIVTIVASLMLSFVGSQATTETLIRLGLLIAGLFAVLLLARNERIDRALTQLIARMLRQYTDLDTRDYARLLKLHGEYVVTEMNVGEEAWVTGSTLAELALTDEGVLVLGVQREDGEYLGAPRGDLPVQAGDTLIVYGPGPRVAELDRRPAGPEGDEAHADAVAEHRLVLNAEAFSDPARNPEDG